MLGLLGLPVERFLTTTNHEERLLMYAIAVRGSKLLTTIQKNQAALVVQALAKAIR